MAAIATALIAMGQTIQKFPARTSPVDLNTINPQEDLAEESAQAYYFRATARYVAGRLQESIDDYDKALELDPNMIIAGKLSRVTARELNAK